MSHTVIYDGECRVCRASVDALRKWDVQRSLELVPFQAEGVRERFHWISEEDFRSQIQVVDEQGATWAGAVAVERLLEILPRGGLLVWVFRLPFARPIAERIYRIFARRRLRFGRVACGDHCSVAPPSEGKT